MNATDKRFEQTLREIRTAYNYDRKMGEVKVLSAELCNDLENEEFTFSWSHFPVFAGTESKLIDRLGLVRCKKSEADSLLFIGEKSDGGFFIKGKFKHYWLRSK